MEDVLTELTKRVDALEKKVASIESRAVKHRVAPSGTNSITKQLEGLKSEGFFNNPKTVAEIVARLATDGFHYPSNSLTNPLLRSIRARMLGRMKSFEGLWTYTKR
jgi:hypothetical protein